MVFFMTHNHIDWQPGFKYCVLLPNDSDDPLHVIPNTRKLPWCVNFKFTKLFFSTGKWRNFYFSKVHTHTPWILNPLFARTSSPGKRWCKSPQFSVIWTSDTRPPHPLEMKDTTPWGGIPIRNLHYYVACNLTMSELLPWDLSVARKIPQGNR